MKRPYDIWSAVRIGQQLHKSPGHHVVPAAVSENDKGRSLDHPRQRLSKLWARLKQLLGCVKRVITTPIPMQMDDMGPFSNRLP